MGTAPANAGHFEDLLRKFPFSSAVNFSVVGFGSRAYPDFCAYARQVDHLLGEKENLTRFLPFHSVNDKSPDEFTEWVKTWSEKSLMALAATPALYSEKVPGLKKFKVVLKTQLSQDNSTFRVLLKPVSRLKFQSGDLLAIYPAHDNRERFYSIGQYKDMIRLVVKLHPGGFGSGFLYRLEADALLHGRVMSNPKFHFPPDVPVAMIANGTGIAPFLGMIQNNKKKSPVHLYAGFRYDNSLAQQYRQFAREEIANGTLSGFKIAFSREQHSQYVMDLIRRDQSFFINLLENKGVIMICGSLQMQQDVEKALDEILVAHCHRELSFYKERNQILTDCY